MDVLEKLTILTDAAKYDAACTSSGGTRTAKKGYIGNTSTALAGCCHTFSADGRCVTLLKVLLTNRCVYDCKYCVNRRSNETRRAAFTPEELADLTIQFYRRNYIEGLFLSSGVFRSPDYTTELMIRALSLLREQYRFNGYIHAKAIPGTSPELVERLGFLADRLSVNIELPSEAGLKSLAPDKTKGAILAPMRQIQSRNRQSREELVKFRHAPRFAPAGQSTQLIVGATQDTDFHILRLTHPPGRNTLQHFAASRLRQISRHSGFNKAWRQRVHRHLTASQFLSQRFGHTDNPRLAGRIVHLAGVAAQSHHAANINNPAKTLLHHQLAGLFHTQKRTTQISGQNRVKISLRKAQQQSVAGDAGIVHQYIHAAKLLHHSGKKLLHLRAVANIGIAAGGLNSQRLNLRHGGFGLVLAAHIVNHNIRPGLGQTQGNGLANAAIAASHQSSQAVQIGKIKFTHCNAP